MIMSIHRILFLWYGVKPSLLMVETVPLTILCDCGVVMERQKETLVVLCKTYDFDLRFQ